MPIPSVDPGTGCLPPGEHGATLGEIEQTFGTGNFRRRELFKRLEWVLHELRTKGVTRIWVAGSFVTSKERPGDVDVVYEPPEKADPDTWGILSPWQRKRLKDREKVDLWKMPSYQPPDPQLGMRPTILDYFKRDIDGNSKGVITLVKGGNQNDSQR